MIGSVKKLAILLSRDQLRQDFTAFYFRFANFLIIAILKLWTWPTHLWKAEDKFNHIKSIKTSAQCCGLSAAAKSQNETRNFLAHSTNAKSLIAMVSNICQKIIKIWCTVSDFWVCLHKVLTFLTLSRNQKWHQWRAHIDFTRVRIRLESTRWAFHWFLGLFT